MGGKKMTHVFSDFVANSMISQLEGCLSGFQRIANLELQIKGKTQEDLSFNEQFLFKEDSVF